MATTARAVLADRRQWIGSLPAVWAFCAPALLSFCVLLSLGLSDGGLLPRAWRLATLALAALGAAALIARKRILLARREQLMVAAMSAFVGWIAFSGFWSGHPDDSLLQAERSVVYAVGLLALFLIVERRRVANLLVGVVAGITAVCAFGLGAYVIAPPPLDPVEGKLLYQPLGYANALGIFAAIGAVLAVGLALWTQGRRRLLALAPLLVLLPTLYYTSSRGGWVALLVGIAVTVRLGGRIRVPALAVVGVLAVAIVAAIVLASGPSQAVSSFTGDKRPLYWEVAVKEYAANPVIGSGAGTYVDYWFKYRPDPSFTRTAHSEYLQALAELGPVGLLLVAGALGLPLLALRGRRDPLLAAAAGAYVAFVLHAGVDWDWEMPAVTLSGLFAGGAVLLGSRRRDAAAVSLPLRLAFLLVVAAVGVVVSIRLTTGPGVPFRP